MLQPRAGVLLPLILILLTAQNPTSQPVTADQGSPSQRVPTITIRGSVHPELIPEHIVWLFFFRNFVNLARLDAVPGEWNETRVQSLGRYELRIPAEQVRIFLQVAEQSVTQYDTLMSTAALAADEKSRNAGFTDAANAVIAGRDELAFRLPRESFEAVKRRAAVTARRTAIDVPIR